MVMMTMMEDAKFSTEMSERIARDSVFLEKVFSWSLDDIFNDDFFSEEVSKIPNSFDTIPEYFTSYVYPLLEETRADLRSSLEIISRAPYAELVSYDVSRHAYGKDRPDQPFLYDFQVDEWRNKFNDRGKEPYKTLPGDIFVLVKSRPETLYDLRVLAQTWVLASVTKIFKENSEDDIDDNSSSTYFTVKASRDVVDMDDSCSSLFLVFLMNSTTHKRIWNALHMFKNTRIIQDVLQRSIADEGCDDSCGCTNNGTLSEDLCIELSSILNRSQYKAVLASLQAMKCKHMSRVQLVWGPPGTGKTKTISTLLLFLRRLNVRTLICAPTNVAITEVAGRLLELIIKTSSDPEEKSSYLGDILLFGNKGRLRVGQNIEAIYLDYRVERLAECFAPLTGWRNCFPSLSNFLEDCVSQYDVFVENEMIKKSQLNIDEGDATVQIESFLAFFRNRFKAASEAVRHCIHIFVRHVSKRYIGEDNIANMLCLIDQLESFEKLLLQDNMSSEELLNYFSSVEVEDALTYAVGSSNVSMLEGMRRKCISVLKSLHQSLGALFPTIMNKSSTTELCFQMASLIFCTASSSYKLYTTHVEPLSVLVVDEAAQLKECESAIPLQLPGLHHAILFGDECQLPAMVQSNLCKDADFGRSLFQRLSLLGWPKQLLNVQYRMHPAISSFPNEEFYFQQIMDAPSVRGKRYERQYLPALMYGPYTFINISEGREELDDDGRSRRNLVEAAVVVRVLHNLHKAWRHSTQKLAIGVISPYAAQVVSIEEMIGTKYEIHDNFRVKVKSVDGFQGGEEDIIIISTVRSNTAGDIGFISSLQRTNVALTRARHCLWVLGNERTLLKSDSIWKRLVCNARERQCFFNADEDKSLTDAMIHIKRELNQLDDLLNKDSILFKSAKWKVLFSDNFVKSFSKLPSNRAKKSVMNLLVKLSNGWRPKKFKADPVCESNIQIVKQYKVEGRYVICTNDIMKESGYTQVLKIWDVVPLEDVSKLVKRLDNVYGAFTDDFLCHCKERGLEGELEVPRTWGNSLDIVRLKNNYTESTSASANDLDGANYAENAKVSESLLLMKFYALSAGIVGHLLSDSDGKALDLPFEVTDEESQIILHQKSSFILGRSGTGKTTVLTMKLYQKEQLHHMAHEGVVEVNRDASIVSITPSEENGEVENVLRQLFVTVSPKLCYAIKQHVSHLKSFARNESSSEASGHFDADYVDDRDQFDGIPDTFFGVPPKSYPLVLTFNKFLFMLDGTLGSSYFERFHDELNFSYGGNSSTLAAFVMKRKEVNYEKFSMSYWPHFNSQFTKKLDSSRVFTEIISSIKGGLQVGQFNDGKLGLEDYLHLSTSRTSTLTRQKREMIYDIFLTYERMKAERGEFDLSDFVNDLHRRLKHGRYGGDIIDFVYIDEVQDLTMRQISLFKYICNNVEEGFVFSGDTAQTIARGIDFRFQDVRCLFYNEFLMSETNDVANGSQARGHISPIFQLRQNFRTHAGILKLGHSVINLIYHFFPHSIDILPPEHSQIFGEAPILLESGSDENAIVTIFGNAGNMGGNLVGFGAEQVILVRDDRVREEITSYVGKHALVLTVVECKGLEFQDVLLYNFFGSSPLKNQWRVIYEFMKVQNLLDSKLQPSFPNFNPAKHNVLCSELKQLYVAITRTRQRLWICENKEDLSKPMFDYWKKLCAVQVRQLDDSLARAMQVASSPEEWKVRGKKLLAVENYEVATMCFERAGDRHWETYAKAAGLKAAAGRTYALNPEEASRILRQAAELFESINVYRKAADCFFELKEYDRAGRIYFEQGKESDLKLAGKCFTLAGHYELAADVFAKCNLFSESLLSCTKGKLYDLGLEYIQYWKQQGAGLDMIELDMIEQVFLKNCALSLHEQDDKVRMMKFVKAFDSEDVMRTFLKNSGCLDELLDLEVELGNFLKAAEITRERGDLLLEADVLEQGGFFKESCELLLWYALAGCLWADGTGWPLKKFPQMEELLVKAKACAHKIEPHDLYKTVCIDSLVFLNRNYSLFELKQFLLISQKDGNLRGEILCTKRILDAMLEFDYSKYEQESDIVGNLTMPHLERISRNKVSVGTLIYFWDLWKEIVLRMFKFLELVEVNEINGFGKFGEFCLNYLGVRKPSYSTCTVFVCHYPDAEWMKEVDKSFFRKVGKLVSVDIKHLLASAHNYWSTELVSTGMKVLNVLDALRKNAWKMPLSDFGKMRLNLHTYGIAQMLCSHKHLKLKHEDSKLLQGHIDVSISNYFKCVFPLDWRRSVSQNVALLREIEISQKLLEEFIVYNVHGKDKMTYGQLGRVAMVLLGSPRSNFESSQLILNRLGNAESPSKPFFQVLAHCIEGQGQSQALLEDSLACKLHIALREVYDVNWRIRDYIFPSCFLYLVDRLMVSLLEIQGCILMTRSSVVEWCIHLEWKANRCTNVMSANDGAKSVFLQDTFCLLARMLHQLLMNRRDTVEWIKKAGINAKENFPVLLLRLVVLMCLLHLNSKAYRKELLHVLSCEEITKQLPRAFTNAVQTIHKVGILEFAIRALNAIEDPLVVVRTGGHPKFSCGGAIIMDIVDQSKEDLLKILYPNNVNSRQDIVTTADKSSNACCTSFPQLKNEEWVEFQDGNVWEVFDTLKLIEIRNENNWQIVESNAPKIKVQIDKTHGLMTTAMAMASENNECTDECKIFLEDGDCLLLELRLLSAVLDTSGQQLKDSMPLIEDSARRLSSRKSVFEYFMCPLFPQKDKATTSEIHEKNVAEKGNDASAEIGDDVKLEDGQKDDSLVAAPGIQEERLHVGEKDQGKGNKKSKSSKKKKKSKKK